MNAARRPSRRIFACLVALTALGACLASTATASISGYQEPTYTKTAANNAFWFQWQAAQGHDINGNNHYAYYLCARTQRNGITVEDHNGPGGPGSLNCTTSLRNGPTPSAGNFAFLPFQAGTVLDDGQRYTLCGYGYYYDFINWHNDSANLGNCPTTIIDRNAPAVSASVNGEDTYTKNPLLALRINYEDATSPPWFGQNGRASNWTCVTRGTTCTPGGNPDADCSIPQVANSRVNAFNCQADVSAIGDGTWYFCARSADAAFQDNPSGTNQFVATSAQANLSGVACGHVTLDRVAPTVTANSSTTTAKVGDLVSFSATAADPAGVGQFDWDFGDNTAHGSGAAVSHTYTQAGTYEIRVSTTDGAGNSGTATRQVVVSPADTGGGTPGGGTPGGGTPGGGTPGGGTPGGGTPGGGTPGGNTGNTGNPGGNTGNTGNTGSTGVTPTNPQQVTPNQIAQVNGGGGAQQQVIGGLGVIAPKTLKIGKAKALTLALTPEQAGSAEVALLKGSKIVAKKGATFGAAGTYSLKLKLPKKLKAGGYSIKVSYTASGAPKAVTKSLKLKVVAAKKAKSRKKAAAKLEGIGGVAKAEKPRPQDRRVKVIR